MMGTPQYMAPEQVRAGALTPATDYYGLGVATYELLAGQTPFAGADVPTVLRRQLQSPPPSLRILRPTIPVRVEEVIFWALAKDPADRPATAGQFARALRAAVETDLQSDGAVGVAGQFLPGTSPVGLDLAAAAQQGGSYARPLLGLTLALPSSALPHDDIEPEFARDVVPADQSTITVGARGIRIHEVLMSPGGGEVDGGYANQNPPGAPPWPVPQSGPGKRTAFAAIAGLAISIVALIIVAVLIGNSVQAAVTGSSRTPRAVASASAPSAHSQQVVPTTTAPGVTGGLVITPSQVTLACQSNQSVTLQLTNLGVQDVSWAAKINASHQSGLAIQPAGGTLAAGSTQIISLSVTSGSGSGGDQGTIQFAVVSGLQAGNATQVSYTTTSCGGGD